MMHILLQTGLSAQKPNLLSGSDIVPPFLLLNYGEFIGRNDLNYFFFCFNFASFMCGVYFTANCVNKCFWTIVHPILILNAYIEESRLSNVYYKIMKSILVLLKWSIMVTTSFSICYLLLASKQERRWHYKSKIFWDPL